jgi:hypothetical protein
MYFFYWYNLHFIEWMELYMVFIVQAYQTSQYVVPRGGIFLCKWRSSFTGSSDGKMNVQSACALNCIRPLKHWDHGFESHSRHGCLFVLFCVQVVALRWANPSSKESYRLCKRSRNWKSGQGPTKGCRAIDRPIDGIVYNGSSHLRSRWMPSLLLQSIVEMAMEIKKKDLSHRNIPHKSDSLYAVNTLKKISLKLFITSDVYTDWC